ncbi:MAG: type I pullulanase, partial [Erysipelotrichaceae bacterium]|nr:type I pullulanase [Erysipelotrichaceae bacterium]
DPYARITEFKQLVSAYHEEGIRIVMDVVYNHMHSLRNNDFEQIVPNYYFRYGPDGAPSNGSFCGNDFDSTRRMSRKFIVDSIKMWMKEYHVDGFRFDLMGIMDIETMNEIVREAKKINPSVFLHGEGWNLPTMLAEHKKATMGNQAALYGVAQFNDFFREHVKGKSSDYELGVCGYGTGDLNYRLAIPACLCGSAVVKEGYVTLFDTPQKSTNYIECHDNATVWDKMKNCCSEEASGVRIARQKMMTAMVLLAQGIPFLHSGQEFCRTKNGVTNSYASPDSVNRLDWDRKDRYLYVSDYVRDVIQLRKSHSEFRLKTTKEIEERVSVVIQENDLLVYTIKGSEPRETVRVLINPTNKPIVYRCKGLYRLILDNKGMCKTEEKSVFTVPELSLCVIER